MGLEKATLKWNEVVDVETQKEQDRTKNGVLSLSGSSDIPSSASSKDVKTAGRSEVETASSDSGLLLETDEHCEITVRFQRDSCPSSLDLLHPENGSSCTSSCSSTIRLVLIARLVCRWRCLEKWHYNKERSSCSRTHQGMTRMDTCMPICTLLNRRC